MNPKLILVFFALVMLSANAMSLRSHEGDFAWFQFDEAATGGACSSSYQCDGRRICRSSSCVGIARPPKNADYRISEFMSLGRCPGTP